MQSSTSASASRWRDRRSAGLPRVGHGRSSEILRPAAYRCIRVLHDETELSLAESGAVRGSDLCWQITSGSEGERLTFRRRGQVVAALSPWEDAPGRKGAWRGHWRSGINAPVFLIPEAPASGVEQPVRPIKIFGLQRSGTNYLQWLVENNFTDVRVLVDETGWKHGPVPAALDWSGKDWHDPSWGRKAATEFVLRRLERLGPEGISQLDGAYGTPRWLSLFIVKNPYAWLHSYAHYRRLPVTPVAADALELWCQRNEAWVTFAEEDPDRALVIAYEDLLVSCAETLQRLTRRGLRRLPGSWRDLQQAMTPMGAPSKRTFDRQHYLQREYLRSYEPSDLERIRRSVPESLLLRLGYDRAGRRWASAAGSSDSRARARARAPPRGRRTSRQSVL